MKRTFARLSAVACMLSASALSAQGVVQQIGPVTSGHVAAWWQNGQIYDGGMVPLPNTTNMWTAKQIFGPGTLNSAPISILPGVAPANAINGDIWTTSSQLFIRLNGATVPVTPLQASNETPGGAVNGSNVNFTLAHAPTNGNIMLYYNGILLEPGAGNDFTLSGTTITMLYALPTGAKLRAYYSY